MTNTEQVNDRKARTRVGTSGIMFDERAAWGVSCSVFVGVEESKGVFLILGGQGTVGGKGSLREQAKTRKKKKLVERNEPRTGQRARVSFQLESSTWDKLPANMFRTHIPTDYGHTKSPIFVSSPSRVSMSARESTNERQP